ncbi:hypothetical protein [Polyangium mundeleinium]|uniref:Tetratricopeptide repeat protein n=1 Tax=Polyangium mundeleinium TaxID=2995306 RepID=A0ABT5EIN2_9BACT|nr:hypothetical protein [Polyangium mundeleinium]MDC0741247.1 hypothetical protein [Polyangium mundeleinium]
MIRAFGGLSLLVALGGVARAETGTDADAAAAVRFEALATMGDRARAAGRLREAAIAYGQALEVRNDPLVAGRLGVLLVEMGTPGQSRSVSEGGRPPAPRTRGASEERVGSTGWESRGI